MHSCSICGDLVADMDCAVTLFFFLEEFINVTPLIKSKKTHAHHASSSNHHYYNFLFFNFIFLREFKSSSLIFISFSFYKRNKCLYIIFKCVSSFFLFFNYEHYNYFLIKMTLLYSALFSNQIDFFFFHLKIQIIAKNCQFTTLGTFLIKKKCLYFSFFK